VRHTELQARASKGGYVDSAYSAFHPGANGLVIVLGRGGVVSGRLLLDRWMKLEDVMVVLSIPPGPGERSDVRSPRIVAWGRDLDGLPEEHDTIGNMFGIDAEGRFVATGITCPTVELAVHLAGESERAISISDVVVRRDSVRRRGSERVVPEDPSRTPRSRKRPRPGRVGRPRRERHRRRAASARFAETRFVQLHRPLLAARESPRWLGARRRQRLPASRHASRPPRERPNRRSDSRQGSSMAATRDSAKRSRPVAPTARSTDPRRSMRPTQGSKRSGSCSDARCGPELELSSPARSRPTRSGRATCPARASRSRRRPGR